MRVLITGYSGFVGGYLAGLARAQRGVSVFGLENRPVRRGTGPDRVYRCDVRDGARVKRVLAEVKPDRIFHLAAQSFVPDAWKDPAATLEINALGAVNLLEAVKRLKLKSRVHIAGSADEYGAVSPGRVPIREDLPLLPLNPYGVSKVVQELLALQYYRQEGMWVVCTRAFTHIGPGQRGQFAVSDFARQIAGIEMGLVSPVIRVGNLKPVRDITDVRDMVRAYWLALERGRPGQVYNISSGRGVSIGEVLRLLIGLSGAKVRVKVEPSRVRKNDTPVAVGDASRFRRDTRWKPVIPLKRTLADILDYWRRHIE